MNSKKTKYCMFASCIAVKGYKRSIIYDISRNSAEIIPNDMFYFIKELKTKTFDEILLQYPDNENKETLKEYISFLQEKEMVFEISESVIKNFPALLMNWESPFKITNMVICLSQYTDFTEILLQEIISVNCHFLEFIFLNIIDLECIKRFLQQFNDTKIISIIIHLPYSKCLSSYSILKDIALTMPRLSSLVIYNCPCKKYKKKQFYSTTLEYFHSTNISCGGINRKLFVVNQEMFTESQNHNTCLNRKLCIDAKGNIKNCLSMNRNFGNIKDTTLLEAIEKVGFKDLWFITKDQIDVCKDCEFRYMCTDCRCFIKDSENLYSQPAKCTYNPYIAKWEGDEGYVPVEECGNYSKETGFVPNQEKIKEINNRVWN